MPLSPRPLHSDPSLPSADETPTGFRAWSQHAGDPAQPAKQAPTSQPLLPGIDVTHPLFKVAAVAFIGYTLGRIVHRRK